MSLSGTRLCNTVYLGNLEAVKEYIEVYNCDVNELSEDSGCSAVVCAVQGNRIEILKYLIKKGANVPENDLLNRNLIGYAIKFGFLEVAEVLREVLKNKMPQNEISKNSKSLDNMNQYEGSEAIYSQPRPGMR